MYWRFHFIPPLTSKLKIVIHPVWNGIKKVKIYQHFHLQRLHMTSLKKRNELKLVFFFRSGSFNGTEFFVFFSFRSFCWNGAICFISFDQVRLAPSPKMIFSTSQKSFKKILGQFVFILFFQLSRLGFVCWECFFKYLFLEFPIWLPLFLFFNVIVSFHLVSRTRIGTHDLSVARLIP